MSDLNDILSNNKGKLPEDKLMAYLEGRLSPEEQREIEKLLTEEGMEADALEGLQNIPAIDAKESVNRINHQLRKDLLGKHPKRRRQIVSNPWAIVAIGVIIFLIVIAYIIIRMSIKI